MNKVLFMGRLSLKNSISSENTYDQNMHYLGGNTGNLAFTTGLETYLKCNNTEIIYTDDLSDILKPKYSSINAAILSCSNWLDGHSTLKYFNLASEIISKSKIRVFVFGLGLQVKEVGGFKYFSTEYNQAVSNFIEAVYLSNGAISVRGQSTKDYFKLLGHENKCCITGCPSIFQVGKEPIFDLSKKEKKYATNGYILQKNDLKHLVNTQVVAQIDQHINYKYLFHGDELSYVNKLNFFNKTELERNFLTSNKVFAFNSLHDWGNFLKEKNIAMAFGSKIHGTIVPIIFGLPAVVISIDQRIHELTEFMGIPKISYEDAKKSNLDDIYEEFKEMNTFKSRYPIIRKNFEEFIEKNQIPMKLPEERTIPRQKHCNSTTDISKIKELCKGYNNQNKHIYLLKKYPFEAINYYVKKKII